MASVKDRGIMNLEDYIKDLAPDLQEKARACGSVEDLLALAKRESIPVPDEALAVIAGSENTESDGCRPITCPKCGSHTVATDGYTHICCNCGFQWNL